MHHPRWREGKLSTGFIAEEFPKGFAVGAPEGEIARRLAAVGAAIDHVLGERKRQISGQMSGRLVQRERRRAVWLERNEIALDIARNAEGIAVRFVGTDGTSGNPHHLVSPWVPGEAVWHGTIDGQLVAMQVRPIANGFRLAHQGFEVAVQVFTESEAAAARLMPVVTAADSGKKLLCPMPGLMVSIAVAEGQAMDDVVFGYVYDFGSGEEWTAERGNGAFLGGERLGLVTPKPVIEILSRRPDGTITAKPDGTFTQVVHGQDVPLVTYETPALDLNFAFSQVQWGIVRRSSICV
jgi:hypothetical protein